MAILGTVVAVPGRAALVIAVATVAAAAANGGVAVTVEERETTGGGGTGAKVEPVLVWCCNWSCAAVTPLPGATL